MSLEVRRFEYPKDLGSRPSDLLRGSSREPEVHLWEWAHSHAEARGAVSEQNSAPGVGAESSLTEEERVRFHRLATPQAQVQFLRSRGMMRTILAGYLGVGPRELSFSKNENGKPELATQPQTDDQPIEFNLSHTEGLSVLALTRGSAIGVDVEKIQLRPSQERIVQRFFAPSEAQAYFSSPVERRDEIFFLYWTAKEAWVKVQGGNLFQSMGKAHLELEPSPRFLSSLIRLWQWAPLPGYQGSLAVSRRDA